MRGGIGVLGDGDTAVAVTKRSDLPVRVTSAVVMVAVAGTAFWLGGWFLTGFIALVGLGIFAEWTTLVLAFERRFLARALWQFAGVIYIGFACLAALWPAPKQLPVVVMSVIAVDVGAYFAGRSFGGPKIAPKISPSKTWSGLGGAIIAVTAFHLALLFYLTKFYGAAGVSGGSYWHAIDWIDTLSLGAITAIIAQSGDFFESWMKRRAGVKDSGRLIPGHGGLFDRADGLIAVLFAVGVFGLISALTGSL